ncbi:hypothetical protein [Haemophilus parahaemolyticus]|uniref:hypothetical protein n=1 Tax=Haemophilus parahaemolyticus TaxID=735 RepID=UPI002490E6DC|nr:hypothetical protein [Haemophilus parahaemolyticus]
MRKIIQVSNSISLDEGRNMFYGETIALCNDGTLWIINSFEDGWIKFPDIPQDKENADE